MNDSDQKQRAFAAAVNVVKLTTERENSDTTDRHDVESKQDKNLETDTAHMGAAEEDMEHLDQKRPPLDEVNTLADSSGTLNTKHTDRADKEETNDPADLITPG